MKRKIATLLNCYIAKLFISDRPIQRFNDSTIQRFYLPGQALVLLLVFITIATTIIGGAVAITIINSQSSSKFALGEEALAVAESGADNAVLRILRDPNSTYVGETLTVDGGSAQITVSYSPPNVLITSQAEVSNIIRKIEVVGTYQNNRLTVTSWKQVN